VIYCQLLRLHTSTEIVTNVQKDAGKARIGKVVTFWATVQRLMRGKLEARGAACLRPQAGSRSRADFRPIYCGGGPGGGLEGAPEGGPEGPFGGGPPIVFTAVAVKATSLTAPSTRTMSPT